jgi:hypothetical protein
MATYARALRWAFGKPPWRALAEERVGVEIAGDPSAAPPMRTATAGTA